MKIFLTLLMAVLVIGAPLAYGSNDSSYKLGYKVASVTDFSGNITFYQYE